MLQKTRAVVILLVLAIRTVKGFQQSPFWCADCLTQPLEDTERTDAWRAFDGNLDVCSISNLIDGKVNHWIRVDFGEIRRVENITVWSHPSYLHGFDILIADQDDIESARVCFASDPDMEVALETHVTCSDAGRYLWVRRPENVWTNLVVCELIIFLNDEREEYSLPQLDNVQAGKQIDAQAWLGDLPGSKERVLSVVLALESTLEANASLMIHGLTMPNQSDAVLAVHGWADNRPEALFCLEDSGTPAQGRWNAATHEITLSLCNGNRFVANSRIAVSISLSAHATASAASISVVAGRAAPVTVALSSFPLLLSISDPQVYPSLAALLATAPANATVLVGPGEWTVCNTAVRADGVTVSGWGMPTLACRERNGNGVLSIETDDVVVEALRFEGGRAAWEGGALRITGSRARIAGCWFQDNVAAKGGAVAILSDATLTGTTVVTENVAGEGGGIFVGPRATMAVQGRLLVVRNQAERGGGVMVRAEGALRVRVDERMEVWGNEAEREGGGLRLEQGAEGELGGALVQMNAAETEGGGISVGEHGKLWLGCGAEVSLNVAGQGAGLSVGANGRVKYDRDVRVTDNRATTGSGGGLFAAEEVEVSVMAGGEWSRNRAAESGGAMAVGSASTVLLDGEEGAPVVVRGNLASDGAGIQVFGGRLVGTQVRLTGNRVELWAPMARGNGAAIYAAGESDVQLSNGTWVEGNSAEHKGGALYVEESRLSLHGDIRFERNLVRRGSDYTGLHGGGGAMYVSGSHVKMHDVFLSGNWANRGGAIELLSSTANITNLNCTMNWAGERGGCIENSGGTVRIRNSHFDANRAWAPYAQHHGNEWQGGAIANWLQGGVFLEDTVFLNHFSERGGTLFCRLGTFDLNRVRIHNSSSNLGSGCIYANIATVKVSNSHLEICNGMAFGPGTYIPPYLDARHVGSYVPFFDYGGGVMVTDTSSLHIVDSTISQGVASHGGGVAVDAASRAVLERVQILGCRAIEGHGGGLVVFSTSSTVSMTSVIIRNNSAAVNGGAVFLDPILSASIHGHSEFSNNTAARAGGGIFSSAVISFPDLGFPDLPLEGKPSALFGIAKSVFAFNVAAGGSGGGLNTNADLQLGLEHALELRGNKAALDGSRPRSSEECAGGGIALRAQASIKRDAHGCPCPTEWMKGDHWCSFNCMQKRCGWDDGYCFYGQYPAQAITPPGPVCDQRADCHFTNMNPNCDFHKNQCRAAYVCPMWDAAWLAIYQLNAKGISPDQTVPDWMTALSRRQVHLPVLDQWKVTWLTGGQAEWGRCHHDISECNPPTLACPEVFGGTTAPVGSASLSLDGLTWMHIPGMGALVLPRRGVTLEGWVWAGGAEYAYALFSSEALDVQLVTVNATHLRVSAVANALSASGCCLPRGQWGHVALSIDAARPVRVVINGEDATKVYNTLVPTLLGKRWGLAVGRVRAGLPDPEIETPPAPECPPVHCIQAILASPPMSCEEVAVARHVVAQCFASAGCCGAWDESVIGLKQIAFGLLDNCDFGSCHPPPPQPTSTVSNLKGAVDELRVWAVARTREAIAEDMAKTCKDLVNTAGVGLVGCYGFELAPAPDEVRDESDAGSNAGRVIVGDKHDLWCTRSDDKWGFCTEDPFLPWHGNDYDKDYLLNLTTMQPEEIFEVHPECGVTLLRFSSNEAGRNGGGFAKLWCDEEVEPVTCYMDGFDALHHDHSLTLFENNFAGNAGGGAYEACTKLPAPCESADRRPLAIPWFTNVSLAKIQFRGNTAGSERVGYGDDVASRPKDLLVFGAPANGDVSLCAQDETTYWCDTRSYLMGINEGCKHPVVRDATHGTITLMSCRLHFKQVILAPRRASSVSIRIEEFRVFIDPLGYRHGKTACIYQHPDWETPESISFEVHECQSLRGDKCVNPKVLFQGCTEAWDQTFTATTGVMMIRFWTSIFYSAEIPQQLRARWTSELTPGAQEQLPTLQYVPSQDPLDVSVFFIDAFAQTVRGGHSLYPWTQVVSSTPCLDPENCPLFTSQLGDTAVLSMANSDASGLLSLKPASQYFLCPSELPAGSELDWADGWWTSTPSLADISPPPNLAQMCSAGPCQATASSSDLRFSHTPSNAVDGRGKEGSWHSDSCFQWNTEDEVPESDEARNWFRIDLESQRNISIVRVYLRRDDVMRMAGFKIWLANDANFNNVVVSSNPCYEDQLPGNPAAIVDAACLGVGRYLYISNNQPYGSLCEVELPLLPEVPPTPLNLARNCSEGQCVATASSQGAAVFPPSNVNDNKGKSGDWFSFSCFHWNDLDMVPESDQARNWLRFDLEKTRTIAMVRVYFNNEIENPGASVVGFKIWVSDADNFLDVLATTRPCYEDQTDVPVLITDALCDTSGRYVYISTNRFWGRLCEVEVFGKLVGGVRRPILPEGMIRFQRGTEVDDAPAGDEVNMPFRCAPCRESETVVGELAGWHCRSCETGFYSIVPNRKGASAPNFNCHRCPTGADCEDGLFVRGSLDGSAWEQDQQAGFMRLVSCPAGFQVVSGEDGEFSQEDQRCEPCNRGEECPVGPCITCQPCQPGHFKWFAGSEACAPCPPNSYRSTPGGAELESCLQCPAFSSTEARTAQTAIEGCICNPGRYLAIDPAEDNARRCMPCPSGAVCADLSCALALDDQLCPGDEAPLGTWQRRPSGEYELMSCPHGFEVLKESDGQWSHDTQQCRECAAGVEYIAHSNMTACASCPLGLTCRGGVRFEPTVEESIWKLVGGVLRLEQCPEGHIGVRQERLPELDHCIECRSGSYTLRQAVNGGRGFVDAPELAQAQCIPCPPGATCAGSQVIPLENFWAPNASVKRRSVDADEQVEVEVYKCGPGACKAGGECEAGREPTSVVCGVCLDGYVWTGQDCKPCSINAMPRFWLFLLVLAASLLLAIVFFEWDTLAAMCSRNKSEAESEPAPAEGVVQLSWATKILDPIKIVVAFLQVISSFRRNLALEWPGFLGTMLALSSLSSGVSLSQFPGLDCALDLDHADDLVFRTTAPLVPIATLLVMRFLRPTWREKKLWSPIILVLFVTYPSTTMVSMQSFNCRTILGQDYLASDYRFNCPATDQGWIYWWSLFCVVVYALGVPIMSLALLLYYNVPTLAHRKLLAAQVDAFLNSFWSRQHFSLRDSDSGEDGNDATPQGSSPKPQPYSSAPVTAGAEQTQPADSSVSVDLGFADSSARDSGWLASHSGKRSVNLTSAPQPGGQAVQAGVPPSLVRQAMLDMLAWRVEGESAAVRAEDEQVLQSLSDTEMLQMIAAKIVRLVQLGLIRVPRPVWDGTSGAEELAAIENVGVAFQNYYVDSYWFESWDFWRKFAVTSVISVVWPDTIEQTQTVLLFCVISVVVNATCQPRITAMTQGMQTHALCALTLTVFFGLLLQTRENVDSGVVSGNLNSTLETTIQVLVTIALFSLFLFPLAAYLSSLVKRGSRAGLLIKKTDLSCRIEASIPTRMRKSAVAEPSENSAGSRSTGLTNTASNPGKLSAGFGQTAKPGAPADASATGELRNEVSIREEVDQSTFVTAAVASDEPRLNEGHHAMVHQMDASAPGLQDEGDGLAVEVATLPPISSLSHGEC